MTMFFLVLLVVFIVALCITILGMAFSFIGVMLGLVFKIAPLICLLLIALFFAKGGKVDVKLPDDWKRR